MAPVYLPDQTGKSVSMPHPNVVHPHSGTLAHHLLPSEKH